MHPLHLYLPLQVEDPKERSVHSNARNQKTRGIPHKRKAKDSTSIDMTANGDRSKHPRLSVAAVEDGAYLCVTQIPNWPYLHTYDMTP